MVVVVTMDSHSLLSALNNVICRINICLCYNKLPLFTNKKFLIQEIFKDLVKLLVNFLEIISSSFMKLIKKLIIFIFDTHIMAKFLKHRLKNS